ncbi:type II toxin-antitoxin system VapC family toxin [Pararhizobium sp.]|uniref:type II toxin-antitoxin system VapC family toxin n=1 Tax=Pararhizobium sp. TaxID=1977563 RepID=UPI0027188164|nr:type II toxin-antitoxin system VapC family toxin [Pararhizobium sp.]MDO9415176.1 type II toxin-antitoxin system VapC family toxin [Pararhizobium sp.]
MVKALFDTNILIDYLNAVPQASAELALYRDRAISIISWMEVMIGARLDVEAGTRAFLNGFKVVSLTDDIAERAVILRQEHRIRLPDAIIWATADTLSMILVTRNSKDFPANTPGVRIPYEI